MKASKWKKTALAGAMLAGLVFMLARSLPERGITVVDFNDVTKGTNHHTASRERDRPVLRVAIAAMISPETTRHYYKDLLALIGRKLGKRTVFIQRKTYAEINYLVEHREIDVAFVCSGAYVHGHSRFGMELLAVPVVNGKSVYYSYIIVGRDSTVKTFEELRGKRFAFTDPLSHTGRLFVLYLLKSRGEKPESYFQDTFYTHSHDNSIQAVAEGLADGASVDSLVWDFLDATDPRYTSRTKIILRSPPYGIPPVVVSPGIDPEMKRRLQKVFLHLFEDRDAMPLLRRLQIDRFEKGNDQMYDSVRQIYGSFNVGSNCKR